MPNSMKGEVPLTLGGEPHFLRFTFGAMREVKEALGANSIPEALKNAGNWGPEEIVALFVAGLKRGSMPDATIEVVEEMMIMSEMESYAEALSQAFNAANTGSTEAPKVNPQAAAAVTSTRPT